MKTKTRTKKVLFLGSIPLFFFVGLCAWWVWYVGHYVHQHCIKISGLMFREYAGDHDGRLPFSTNGFGNALLLLAKDGESVDDATNSIRFVCGPDDDGHIFMEALKNNSVVPEDKCSRVYIQGLCDTNDPQICILFDRNSCPGGDHFHSPWGHRVREVCMLDGAMEVISDEKWPEFSRQQVDLLVAAGFSRTNALHFYPAAQ